LVGDATDPVVKARRLGPGQPEPVGAGADKVHAQAAGMADHRHQVIENQKRLPAGERHHLDPLGRGGLQHGIDLIEAQAVAGHGIGNPHSALGATGVAAVGDLDDELAGNPAPGQVAKGIESVKMVHVLEDLPNSEAR